MKKCDSPVSILCRFVYVAFIIPLVTTLVNKWHSMHAEALKFNDVLKISYPGNCKTNKHIVMVDLAPSFQKAPHSESDFLKSAFSFERNVEHSDYQRTYCYSFYAEVSVVFHLSIVSHRKKIMVSTSIFS